jgi:tetratricopeptide (TPR) repeat protein
MIRAFSCSVLAMILGMPLVGQAQNRSFSSGKPVSGASPTVQKLLRDANKNLQDGKPSEAQAKVTEAVREADRTLKSNPDKNAGEVKTGLLIRQGQLMMQNATNASNLEQSLKIFEQVARESNSPREKALAEVNKGAALMRLNRPQAAANVLEECDWNQFDWPQWPVLYYNSARALEESGQTDKALQRYAKSLVYEPTFDQAAQRLEALAAKLAGPDGEKIYETGRHLVELGVPRNAINFALQSLKSPAGKKALENSALRVLLLAWSRTYVNPEVFDSDLELASEVLSSPRFAPLVKDVRAATREPLRVENIRVRKPGSNEILPPFEWASTSDSPVRDAFASFLAATARPYMAKTPGDRSEGKINNQRLTQAFARIYGAWTLSPNDLELARQVAWLTHDFGEQVDPNGFAREQLTDMVFVTKGILYRVPVKTAADWQNLLELHTFLGLLFEADKKWGDEYNVQSAIGQWNLAIRAEEEVRRLKQDDSYFAPGLREHLGNCYATIDRKPQTFDLYVEAGQGFLKLGDVLQSKRMADAARDLGITPGSDAKKRLEDLVAAIQRAERDP